ncbi:MAG: hypothetical protein ACE37D_14350 [Pseudomonadales bacterium]
MGLNFFDFAGCGSFAEALARDFFFAGGFAAARLAGLAERPVVCFPVADFCAGFFLAVAFFFAGFCAMTRPG